MGEVEMVMVLLVVLRRVQVLEGISHSLDVIVEV